MIIFGGGNEGIVDELHVFNTGECCFLYIFKMTLPVRRRHYRYCLPAGMIRVPAETGEAYEMIVSIICSRVAVGNCNIKLYNL
jgi:hypothetical protein